MWFWDLSLISFVCDVWGRRQDLFRPSPDGLLIILELAVEKAFFSPVDLP